MKDLIAENEKRLLKAIKSRDIKELDTLLHNDLLFNGPDGITTTKQTDIEAYSSGKIRINSIETSNRSIKMIGDTAISVVTIHLNGQFFDQAVDGEYRYLRVWKKCESDWKIIAGSCNTL